VCIAKVTELVSRLAERFVCYAVLHRRHVLQVSVYSISEESTATNSVGALEQKAKLVVLLN